MIKNITIIAIFTLIAVSAVYGCEFIGEDNADCAAVFAAEEEITIEERAFTLDAELWVNLMPPVPPEGPDLNVTVKITARDGEDFPEGYTADYVWLSQNDTIVVLEFVEERPRELSGNNVLEKIARTKSKLDPESPVDVVTRIITTDGEKYYLRAPERTITVTH
ncbi:MAG: hypothetical protein GY771_05150 [bacterium]|nr:hypothetical protein [bacterium]